MAVVGAACLLGALPAASQPSIPEPLPGPTPVTLYLHLLGSNFAPINTQAPPAGHDAGIAPDAHQLTASCMPAGQPALGGEHLLLRGVGAPWLVRYDPHPPVSFDPGVGYDVAFDAGQPAAVTVYLHTAPAAGAPIVVPAVSVEAAMRTGDLILEPATLDAGDMLAQGEAKAVLAGPATGAANAAAGNAGVRYVGQVHGRHVHEVAVPLAFEAPVVPAATGYNLLVRVRLDEPACGDGALMPSVVGFHTDRANRPRLEASIREPLRADGLQVEGGSDGLRFEAAMRSAWGAYDVDVANATLRIVGPDRPSGMARGVGNEAWTNGTQSGPATVAWEWGPANGAIVPRDYTAELRFSNLQHTANVTSAWAFRVDGARDAPGPAAWMPVLATMAALALLVRRGRPRRVPA